MNRGYVKNWRKSLDSPLFRKPNVWHFWDYCRLKATHKKFTTIIGNQAIDLMPGQFIFGHRIAAQETGLTIRQIRTSIELLKRCENLTIKTTNKYSIITIVNWDIYQSPEIENDTLSDTQLANKRQHTRTKEHKNIKDPSLISEDIIKLQERYSDQELINQAFQAISSTRKTKRITDTVKLKILNSWNSFPIDQVQAGIKTYLEKEYFKQPGKDEKYLLGIIRNTEAPEIKGSPAFKSTGSKALDDYYRQSAEAGK